jgi:hypothetical protein
MIQGRGARVVMWSGFATAALLIACVADFATFAFNGGLQSVLATDAPPPEALTGLEILTGMAFLYVLIALVFTVSLAVVQFSSGSRKAVVGGLGALGAGIVLVLLGAAGGDMQHQVLERLGLLGFAGYLAAASLVGLPGSQLNRLAAGFGLAAGAALMVAGVGGLYTSGLIVLAPPLYAAWAMSFGIVGLRRRALSAAASQAVLQTGPADR